MKAKGLLFISMMFGIYSGSSNAFASHQVSAQLTENKNVILFVGEGTWGADVASLENILSSHGTNYKEVDTHELEEMSLDAISKFDLMIFPGGQGGTQAGSLSSETHAKLRKAVQERGVSYFGICAGAFIAVAPKPQGNETDVSYGFGVVDGPVLDYYYLQNEGTDIAMALEKFPDGTTRDILWYGGPVTPSGTGTVIAKYPDGHPAISQMWSGKGFVILAGGHPTATQETLDSLGLQSSDGVHLDLTWDLIQGAILKKPLQAF